MGEKQLSNLFETLYRHNCRKAKSFSFVCPLDCDFWGLHFRLVYLEK